MCCRSGEGFRGKVSGAKGGILRDLSVKILDSFIGMGCTRQVSCGSVWSPNCCVAETVLQFLILLPLPPESQDFMCVPD